MPSSTFLTTGMHCSGAQGIHACKQQFIDQTSASVRLSDSFMNLDSCVEDGFFFLFGVWIRRIGPLLFPSPTRFDLASTPTVLDSSRHRSSISLTTAPSILFAKDISFEELVSSPRLVITSRRKENVNNKAYFFQYLIDGHGQSASSCLISPHFAAVGVGSGAASFLATESTGTVLIPRLMTRIAGHGFSPMSIT